MTVSIEKPNWQPEFRSFWPTMLVKHRFADCEQPNQALANLIEEMDRARDQLTANYQGADFLKLDKPAVKWLRRGIEKTVAAYFVDAGMDYPIEWSVQSWANINRRGDYHAPHNHAWCYLSGTYYVKMPLADASAACDGADSPAAISFYDPRAMVNMLAIGSEAGSRQDYTLYPEPGTLLVWHSSVNHMVHPNLSSHTRITISFNIVLQWANHYIAAK